MSKRINIIETAGKQNLREQLIADYRANAERDLSIATEWFPLEEQAWKIFNGSRRK